VKNKSVAVELTVEEEAGLRKPYVVRGREAYTCFMPLGFHILAREFLGAAEDIQVKGDFSLVQGFLYCRSIELSLKAFLLAKNVPVSRFKGRKGIGHDLNRGLKEAELKGLVDIVEIPSIYKEELRKANDYYATKQGFEYMDDYDVLMRWRSVSDFPSIEVLSDFASRLVAKLGKVCEESVRDLIEKAREGKLHGNGE
jgi:hypothetical protein